MTERTISKKIFDHIGGLEPALLQFKLTARTDILRVVDGENHVCYNGAEEEVPCPKQYPSLGKMARNLAGAVARTTSAVARRERVSVPKDIYQQRLAICHRCELWDGEAFRGSGRCRECGCSTKTKLKLAQEECPHPDGPRWPAYTRS